MRGLTAGSSRTNLSVPGMIVAGIGAGLVNVPLAATAVGIVEPARAGMASGINTTFRQVGTATGVAALGAILASRIHSTSTGAAQTGFVDGLNLILLVGAGVAFAAAAMTFLLIRERDFVDSDTSDLETPEPELAQAAWRSTDRDWLAARFDEQRPQLRRVAYRMLGTLDEADDAVQEAWLRLSRTDTEAIREPGRLARRLWSVAFHSTCCAHGGRGTRRYVGSWLPEPIVTVDDSPNPEEEALVADAVGLALFVVLETLTPPERLAFVLHDMFAVSFEEIAVILDRRPAARATTREPCPSPRSRCETGS